MSFPEPPYDPQRASRPTPQSAPQVAVGPPPPIGGPPPGPAFSGPGGAPMGWPYAPPPRKRRVWPWIVGGAALLVMLLVGGLVLIGVVVAASRASDTAGRKPLGSAATPAPAISYSPLPDPAYPAPTGQATNRTHTAKVGETIVWERRGFEANWTIVSTEQKTVAEFNQKPTRGLFVLAHLTVAQKQGSNFACACTLQFVAANGRVYQNDFNSFPKHERFQSQNIGPGQSLDGWVAFDVPADAVKGGKIQWSPNLIDDDLRGYWLL